MIFALKELLWVGVVPCAVAALVMIVSTWLRVPARVAWAKSVGGAYVFGQVALAARVGWRAGFGSLLGPREAGDWLPWLVMAAVGITVLAAYAPQPWQRWIVVLAALLAVTAPVRLLASSVYVTGRWSTLEKFAVVAQWSAAFATIWTWLSVGRACGKARLRSGLLIVVAIVMAAILTLSGSFVGGEYCCLMAAALTGALVIRLLMPRLTASIADDESQRSDPGLSGAAGAVSMALGGLILLGYFYAELPAASAALLFVSLVAAGGRLPTGWPRGSMWQAFFRVGLCLVPLAMALALIWAATQSDAYR